MQILVWCQTIDFREQRFFAEQKVWVRGIDGRTEAKGCIENATRSTFSWFNMTKALILLRYAGMIENVARSLVSPGWHTIENVHLGIVDQRKFTTEGFDKDLQCLLFIHQMWWKLWAIGTVDAIAFVSSPKVHRWCTIEVIDESQFSQIVYAWIDCERFATCAIALENEGECWRDS